ncbi:MAG: hypothetical protein M0R74_18870 [Dehalococcoidia bacterium]|nr:hypothetical protein [Dehalococcoidia bacterium]
MTTEALAPNELGEAVDNTNHDLLHTLSVRLDARWHDRTYEAETHCDGCKKLFERLRELDREAINLLSAELVAHVRSNRFPLDLTD